MSNTYLKKNSKTPQSTIYELCSRRKDSYKKWLFKIDIHQGKEV